MPDAQAESGEASPRDRREDHRDVRDRRRGGSAAEPTVEELLRRMQAGDRGAAADFVTRFSSRIRRRIRGKLNPAMRRLFDSQEIISSVGRRLDLYVLSGRLEITSTNQLWKLVLGIADNAVIDKARVFRRLQRVENEDSAFAHELAGRLRAAERESKDGFEIELARALEVMHGPIDRQILTNWLLGIRLSTIAEMVELKPTTVRKRWQKIRETILERLLKVPHR